MRRAAGRSRRSTDKEAVQKLIAEVIGVCHARWCLPRTLCPTWPSTAVTRHLGWFKTCRLKRPGPCKAKFRVPRNLSQSHEFQRVFRPALHFTCVLIPVVLKLTRAVRSLDFKPCQEQVCVSCPQGRALDLCKGVLDERGLSMPHHVIIEADNTCREERNQWTFA